MTDFPVSRPGWLYRLFLHWLRKAAKGQDGLPLPQSLTPESLAALRRMTGMPSFPQRLSSLQIRRWSSLSVPCGNHFRPARLYRPRGKVTGLVLFLHGGGFVHCDLVSHHASVAVWRVIQEPWYFPLIIVLRLKPLFLRL
ncbi:alpha/beta hydrolase family protein [Asaia prunellae]|uniref:hypothetical protein n=1 Tax=Asaia prunellae TaxID=610245 RepID=UPI000AAF534C|nr:hypothetical protein [Asaia prunellae]